MFLQAITFLLLISSVGWAQKPAAPSTAPSSGTLPPEAATPPKPPPPLDPPPLDPPPPPGAEEPPAVPAGTDTGEFAAAERESLKPSTRDPFAKPKSLLEKEVESVKPVIDPSVYIDMRIEPIRRFPLRNYLLVGIIFDVDSPKAMVKDPDNNMHLLTTNQRIGNQEGTIIKIERGELVVEEKGKLVTIRLHK